MPLRMLAGDETRNEPGALRSWTAGVQEAGEGGNRREAITKALCRPCRAGLATLTLALLTLPMAWAVLNSAPPPPMLRLAARRDKPATPSNVFNALPAAPSELFDALLAPGVAAPPASHPERPTLVAAVPPAPAKVLESLRARHPLNLSDASSATMHGWAVAGKCTSGTSDSCAALTSEGGGGCFEISCGYVLLERPLAAYTFRLSFEYLIAGNDTRCGQVRRAKSAVSSRAVGAIGVRMPVGRRKSVSASLTPWPPWARHPFAIR